MDFLAILDSTDIGRDMQLIYEGSICAQSDTVKIDMTGISLLKNLKEFTAAMGWWYVTFFL